MTVLTVTWMSIYWINIVKLFQFNEISASRLLDWLSVEQWIDLMRSTPSIRVTPTLAPDTLLILENLSSNPHTKSWELGWNQLPKCRPTWSTLLWTPCCQAIRWAFLGKLQTLGWIPWQPLGKLPDRCSCCMWDLSRICRSHWTPQEL